MGGEAVTICTEIMLTEAYSVCDLAIDGLVILAAGWLVGIIVSIALFVWVNRK